MYRKFLSEKDKIFKYKKLTVKLKKWYLKVFKHHPPNKNWYLIFLKINYMLYYNYLKEQNKPITPKIRNNYIAARTFEVSRFSEVMKSMISIYTRV